MSREPTLPDIDDKVDFLASPAAYADHDGEVEVRETHMSWVFLTRRRVYKLKKPSIRKMIDLSSPDARYRNCTREVELNSRLGPDVYIGIEQLSVDAEGKLKLGKDGVPTDWLVVMHRIPEQRFLEAQIKGGSVDYTALEEAAKVLTDFYQRSSSVEMTRQQYLERFGEGVLDNHESLSQYELPPRQLALIRDRQLEFLRRASSMVGERAERGMIVEAHGDLRPEHLCLTDPPVAIDCLEFNRDLRILDRVDELSFLWMECEQLGDSRAGQMVLARYSKLSDDHPPGALVAFYKCYRACIRAKLSAWHLDDVPKSEARHWLDKAESYLDSAERYAMEFE